MKLHDSIKNGTLTERQEGQEIVLQGSATMTYSIKGAEYDLFQVPDPLYRTSDGAHDSHFAAVIHPREKGKEAVVFTPRSSSARLLYGKSNEADIDKCLRRHGYGVLQREANGPFGPVLTNDWDSHRVAKSRVWVVAGPDIDKARSIVNSMVPTAGESRYTEEMICVALVFRVDEQNRHIRLATARWNSESSQWSWGEDVAVGDCTLRPISSLAVGVAYLGYGLSVPIDILTGPLQAIYFLWLWYHPM